MSVLGKILVKLGLDNSEYKKGLNDSKQSTDKFSSVITKIGGAIAGAFTIDAIKNFAINAVKAYNESAAAAAKFNAVVRATGGAAGITTEEMQRFASQLQSVTTFEDDATVGAASLLATFKSVNGDVFKEAIKSSQDLATIMGTDLQGAIMQIGKALESPEIGLVALRRSGISFTDAQIEQIKKLVAEGKKQEAQLIILKEVQSQVGGAARAAANTAEGAWKQLGNAIGDLMEQIGSNIEKTTPLAEYLKDEVERLVAVINSQDLTFWEKLKVIIAEDEQAINKLYKEEKRLREEREENRAVVNGIMREINSVAEAQAKLKTLTDIEKGSYQELLKQELQAYIKRQEAAKLDREEKQKQIELTKQLALAEKGRGEIPQKEAEIESLRNKLKNAFGEERQQIIDAIALRQQELAILRMTTAEKVKARNEKAIQTPAMTGFDINAKWQEGGKLNATDPFTAWLENNKKARQGAIEDLSTDIAEAEDLSKRFNWAVAAAVAGGMQELANGIMGVGDVDLGSVIAALLSPFGDLAIQLGMFALATGLGISAIFESLATLNPAASIAAGIALIALGSVIKAGVSALGKSKGKSGGAGSASTTSYSGGGAVAGYSGAMATTSAMNINVTGRISGSDIVLSYDKTKDNKSR